MNFINARLKIRQFFKKYKRIVIFVLLVWAIIIAINYFLKNMPEEEVPKTTYEPNVSVMQEDNVPEKWQPTIEDTVKNFVDYCNNKEYQKAYDMLSDDCKEALYPQLSSFQEYVDTKFSSKRSYAIQNFSNVGNQYIYDVNLFEDIMATGLTGKEFGFITEKFVFTENDNSLKLSIGSFVRKQDIGIVGEDENLKVDVNYKNVFYDHEIYYVTITNRTNHTIVLADGSSNDEVTLNIGDQNRADGIVGTSYNAVLLPGETKDFTFYFNKYCDDGRVPQYLKFNNIRVLNSYSGDESTRQAELDNAVRIYTLQLNFNVEEE